jgi:hypothetical protein
MRMMLVAMLAAFCLLGSLSMAPAGTYQADGTYQGSPSAAVSQLFAAYPSGGDALVAALRELLLADPTLADDVAYLGARSGGGQQSAAADALAQALIVLTSRGNTFGVGRIVAAAQYSGNITIQTAVNSAVATAVGSTFYAKSGQTNCTTTGGSTVSPARPPITTCQ